MRGERNRIDQHHVCGRARVDTRRFATRHLASRWDRQQPRPSSRCAPTTGPMQEMFDFTYMQGTEPGEWRFTPDFPLPLAFGPHWGTVTPFVLKRGSQFRPRHPV